MVESSKFPATRSSLLRLRRERDETRQGFTLLERKREVLLRELRNLLRAVEYSERPFREGFAAGYRALREARLNMGSEGVDWAALAPAANTHSIVAQRTVMGVALPQVKLVIEPLPLPYSPHGSSASFDEARERWLAIGKSLGDWIESVGAIWRVATELTKTQRRVNALEYVLLPQYDSAIKRIENTLEEQDREAFVRARHVKAQQKS